MKENLLLKVFLFGASLVLLTAVFSFSSSAWAAPVINEKPHIIFIVVDALRADHVSAYGYERQTTPNLDKWVAEQGVLFRDATAASSWTNPSNGAMLTSHFPSNIDTVWSDMDRSLPQSEMLLAEYLKGAGYFTAGFVSNWWLRAQFGYDQGFDIYQHTSGEDARRAFAINELAVSWLDSNWQALNQEDQPLFLFLYYLDPHTWYDPPPTYDTMYDDSYTGTLTAEAYGHGQQVVAGNIVPSERDIEHLLALYDGEITYWDHYLGQMFEYLQSNNLMDNSIVIVTSDHGQMFGEHGKWIHRNSLYEEVIRVPLLYRHSGQVAGGQVFDQAVHTMDITPTLLEAVGIPVPEHLQGISLLPLMHGGPVSRTRPIFSEITGETDPQSDAYWIAPRTDLFSVKIDGWKYIHTQQGAQEDELYMVHANSLFEKDNLINKEPQKADKLYSILNENYFIPSEFLFLPMVGVESAE